LTFSDQWQWLLSVLSVHCKWGALVFLFPYIYISAASSLFVVVVVVAHFLQVFVVFRFGEENAGYKTMQKSIHLQPQVHYCFLRKCWKLYCGRVWVMGVSGRAFLLSD
jgi:hypothetical protein